MFLVFFFFQITNKCLPSILKLQYLEHLALEGCLGFDDDSLAALKQGFKSLEVYSSLEMLHLLVFCFDSSSASGGRGGAEEAAM